MKFYKEKNIVYNVFLSSFDDGKINQDKKIKLSSEVKESRAVKVANKFVKSKFFNKNRRLFKNEEGIFNAIDFENYGRVIFIEKQTTNDK